MTISLSLSPWAALADEIDPPEPPAELADPVSLAAANDPKYVIRPHLRVIGDVMARLEAREYDRLVINLPPQTGKSMTAVEWGAFWLLCRRPSARIIIGSYGSHLALRRSKAIRKLVRLYGAAYGIHIERGSDNQTDWSTTAGGGVLSVGVAAGVTGRSGDFIFIDDPIKSRADADSVVWREKVWDWYSADLMSRQQPDTQVILVQTPWHVDDLRARVLAHEGDLASGGRWKVVRMPAFADAPDDPLGREIGEPLPHPKLPGDDPERLTKHWLAVKATEILRDWLALWMCDPKPAVGTLLSWQVLRERRRHNAADLPARATVAVAIDPSGGGRDTAGIIGGFLSAEDKPSLYITHDRSGRMSSDQWSRAACELAADTEADRFIIETNYGGDMATLALRTAWQALRREQPGRFGEFVPRIVTVTARRGKLLRAEPIAQQWIESRIWTTEFLAELESEWATWQPTDTASPGRIDASVYLAYSLLPVPQSGAADMAGANILARTQLLTWGSGR